MPDETVTQFTAQALGLLPYPPGPKQAHADLACWLCGGRTDGVGWAQDAVIAPTFAQHNLASRPGSKAVCQACAALARASVFQDMVRRRALPIKLWAQAGWHSYSHHLREDGHYEAPIPARMRDILLDPPSERWVLAVNTSGKKHTLFRGAIADGRVSFPVQLDETTLWLRHADIVACLADFERLSALGCAKDGVETGRYHPADTMRAGLAPWRAAEARMAPWRVQAPGLVALVRLVARSARFFAEERVVA